jgi:4-diphosphocytidyl-2-C-methyl-D-erythritol kinase
MQVTAPAKINLTLEVLGKRADGYHQVVTVLQTIDLQDILCLEPATELELICSDQNLQCPENLVWKAAVALRATQKCGKGARIWLTKRVPLAMGLGGGSSDAAAVLKALDHLWRLGLGIEGLHPVAESLGSDVPFFLHGGTALAEGRGEVITPLPCLPKMWAVILCPQLFISSKTERLYAMLSDEHYSPGVVTRRLVGAIESGRVGLEMLHNTFEEIAPKFFGGFNFARSAMIEAGAKMVHLCGSGPALFSLVHSKDEGERLVEVLKNAGWKAYLVNTI